MRRRRASSVGNTTAAVVVSAADGVRRGSALVGSLLGRKFSAAKPKGGEAAPPKTFNLTVVCIPTAPGWSRAIIYGGAKPTTKAERKAQAEADAAAGRPAQAVRPSSMAAKVFKALPVWLVHLLSNRFLDSDLAFLHYQARARTGEGRRHAPRAW